MDLASVLRSGNGELEAVWRDGELVIRLVGKSHRAGKTVACRLSGRQGRVVQKGPPASGQVKAQSAWVEASELFSPDSDDDNPGFKFRAPALPPVTAEDMLGEGVEPEVADWGYDRINSEGDANERGPGRRRRTNRLQGPERSYGSRNELYPKLKKYFNQGLTQTEMMDKLGVSKSTVQRALYDLGLKRPK
jgi:hypothetical protein